MPLSYVFPKGTTQSASSSLSLPTPAPVAVAFGTTTANISISAADGGTAPYTYDAVVSFDSTGSHTAYISSVSGSVVAIAGLVNGQTLGVTITATDATGDVTSVVGYVQVAAAAAGTMTAGAFPSSKNLMSGSTSTTITFNAVGGTFTAPVSYAATIISGSGSVSNVGLEATLSSLVDGETTLVRLQATDSTPVTPKTADAYALVTVASSASPLVWQTIRQFDMKAQGSATLVTGAQTVNLTDANTGAVVPCTLTYSMGSGSFATMTCTLSAANGWRHQWASTATGTYLRGPLQIPLGLTLGLDDEVRIIIVGKGNNAVSGNSFYFQVDNAGSSSEDASGANGFRLLKSGANTAMYLRAAGSSGASISNSSTPPCPTTWQDGSTVLTETLTFARRCTRAYVAISGTGSLLTADLGHTSTTPSSNAVRGGWSHAKSTLTIQHMGSNGSANGLGAQYSEIHSIIIQRRTLP